METTDKIIVELERLINQVQVSKSDTSKRFNYTFLLGAFDTALAGELLAPNDEIRISREIHKLSLQLYIDPEKTKGDD